MNKLLGLQMIQSGFDFTNLISEHYGLIFLMSSTISLIFAVVMLAPFRRGATEKWAQFFGGAFAIFFIQYAARCAAHLLITYHLIDSSHHETVKMVVHITVMFCSAGNNLMFLAAALTLIGRESPFPPVVFIIIAAISLISIFDITAWRPESNIAAQPSLIYFHFLSIPDAIFSAVCFSAIGYATATSIFYRKFPLLSLLAVLVGTLYAFVQIVYGFGPLIFNSAWLNNYFPLQAYFGTLNRLNASLFAIAMPLKFFLFLPGYVLHQRSVTAFYDIQDMLKNVVGGRDEFISHDGIVSVIGHRFRADFVDLSIKLPGTEKEYVASFIWDKSISHQERKKVAIVKSVESSPEAEADEKTVDALIRWGLDRDKPFQYPQKKSAFKLKAREVYRKISTLIRKKHSDYVHDTKMPEDVRAEVKDKKALLLLPVQFHGATIGCIKIERSRASYRLGRLALYLPFSNSALNLAKKISDLAAPSIQAYRELATLDRLSLKFAQALSLTTTKSVAKGERKELPYAAQRWVKLLADIVQDSLAPEAMRFVLDFGFSPTDPVDTGDEKYIKLLREKLGDKDYNDLPTYMEDNGGNCFKLYKRELFARTSEKGPASMRSVARQFRLGYLVLAVRLPNDQMRKPVLGANYLHRKAIASILADAILDLARAFFASQLKELSTKLNKEEHLEIQRWFSDIEEEARHAGLLWLVTRQQAGAFLGNRNGIESVKGLNAGNFPKGVEAEQQSTVGIHPEQVRTPTDKTRHVVRLDLPNSKYQLWLGVERSKSNLTRFIHSSCL